MRPREHNPLILRKGEREEGGTPGTKMHGMTMSRTVGVGPQVLVQDARAVSYTGTASNRCQESSYSTDHHRRR
jgi:hypothetical protein